MNEKNFIFKNFFNEIYILYVKNDEQIKNN